MLKLRYGVLSRSLLAFMVIVLLAPTVLTTIPRAQAAGSDSPPAIPFEKYKLKNGLDVILSEDHRLPMVAVNLWYHVGPANERPGLTGFAHLFEHMMFEGSQHVGAKKHFKFLESAGASIINGTTDFDRTNYFETMPSNQLELALWLESDRMGYLLGTLDREKLANQRDIVRNERRQSIESAPYGIVEEEIYHQLFPKGHPYYAHVIGSHADIEAARVEHVRNFFKQYYTPNNCSLAIVGDFKKDEVKALVEKYFGSIPSGPEVPKIEATTPPITLKKKITVTDQVELPRVYMDWITPVIFKSGDAEADLIAHILGGGKSSRLYKKLVYEKQIAQDVSVENNSLLLGSVFQLQATAKPGVKPDELEKAINDELAEFRQSNATQKELDGARNTIESGMIRGLESLGGFGGKADRLNQYNHFLGDPGYLPRDIERYDNATLSSLKQVTDKYLGDNSCVVVYGINGKKVVDDVPRAKGEPEQTTVVTEGTMPDEPWRANPPKPGPMSRLSLPIPISFKLKNGLTVYLVERHELPIVAMILAIINGSTNNPIDKPGLASFTADMLDEGTTNRSALKIADDLDQIGASVHPGSGLDSDVIGMSTLKKTLEPAVDILSDMLLHPVFDAKEVERVRNDRVTALMQVKDNPNAVARRVMWRVLYGTKNQYGYETAGTIDSNKKISRDDMLGFWEHGYVPGNSALAIAGDITEEQARSIAEKYFGTWKGSAAIPKPPSADRALRRTVYIVNKESAPQTSLRIAGIGLARSNPDFAASEIMNNGLGGIFSSRLNMNLREKHGYTYGAFSSFSYQRGPGPFAAGAGIKTDVTGPAVSEFFKEINGMHSNPLSREELKMAKDNWALSLPGLFETSPAVAGTMAGLYIYNLPNDYYSKLPGRIDSVTAQEVEAVATKYLKPDNMVVVAVGDKAKIEPEFQKLNLGPIEELDWEANPVGTPTNASLSQPTSK